MALTRDQAAALARDWPTIRRAVRRAARGLGLDPEDALSDVALALVEWGAGERRGESVHGTITETLAVLFLDNCLVCRG